MAEEDTEQKPAGVPSIYVVSGGMGAVGEEVVRSALAQFPGVDVPIILIPRVRHVEQLDEIIEQVVASDGVIVHTMMDAHIRHELIRMARRRNVSSIDLVGHLLGWLTKVLHRKPLGRPGLYRQLRQSYYERIEAIEYTVAHDDGRNPQEWQHAEIVLTGVSRTGKTPLSMYLSVQGWKVANVPLVKQVPPPPELFKLDPRRVIGLVIDPGLLMSHRQKRQNRLGIPLGATYTDLDDIYDEVEATRRVFRRGGFSVVDVTDKPIEESAEEVITLITRPGKSHLS